MNDFEKDVQGEVMVARIQGAVRDAYDEALEDHRFRMGGVVAIALVRWGEALARRPSTYARMHRRIVAQRRELAAANRALARRGEAEQLVARIEDYLASQQRFDAQAVEKARVLLRQALAEWRRACSLPPSASA